MRYVIFVILASAFVLGNARTLYAQTEITLLAPGPIKAPLEKLIAGFESATADQVKVTYAGGLGTTQQVAADKALDVSIMFSPFPEALASGNIDRNTATTIAILRLGIAVRKGATKPNISTPAAVKQALLSAKTIACVDPSLGSGGVAALQALKKLGITDKVKPKIKFYAHGNLVQEAVANGEAEMSLGPYVHEMNNPGIDVVGGLPSDAATPIEVVGFISTRAKDRAAAEALLKYLSSPDAASTYEAARIEPYR